MNRMISDLPDLAQRVEKLEKANRRLKLAGVLALALVGCLLLLGVASPKRTVEAEKFLLRDANGKIRASLDVVGLEGPMLFLLDANEDMRVTPSTGLGGAALRFFDANEKVQVILAAGLEEPTLILTHANGKGGALLTVDREGPKFALLDANGKEIFSAPR